MNILIVEDNEMNRHLMGKYMQKLGWEYSVAENGLIAVDIFKSEVFDAVLMDIDMPILNGIEATKVIREFNTITPIIAISAYSDEIMRSHCAHAGMNAFRAKPCSIEEIKEVVMDCIEISQFNKK